MVSTEVKDKLIINIAESDFSLGNLTKSSLRAAGMEGATMITTEEGLYEVVNNPMHSPYVLLIDSRFLGDGIQDFVFRVRNASVGVDPFALIFCTINNPTHEKVSELSNCGIDEVFIKPYAASAIIRRIDNIAIERKPYVVTSDYLGPDRRRSVKRDDKSEEKPNPLGTNRISVPNPIKMLAKKNYSPSLYAKERAESIKKMNAERINNFMFQLAFNGNLAVRLLGQQEHRELFISHADSIAGFAKKAKTFSKQYGLGNAHIPSVVEPVEKLAESVSAATLTKEQAAQLEKLCFYAFCATHPDTDSALIISEVKKSAERYLGKMLS